MTSYPLTIRTLGRQDYAHVWQAMQTFTDQRDSDTEDELWFVEHAPVFTQGQAGKEEHILNPGDIPIVKVDRGGQVTYHGPGQLVCYTLIDLKRRKMGVRELVTLIENAIINTLDNYNIKAKGDPCRPGVYVEDKKIASLGLRVRRGCSFHGLALNIDMDLTPFLRINPCGYAGLEMIQAKDLTDVKTLDKYQQDLTKHFAQLFDASNLTFHTGLIDE